MSGRFLGLAALALTAATLALPATAAASFPGRPGQIAFSAFRYAPRSLVIEAIKPSGKGRKRLLTTSSTTHLPGGPAYSPLGDRLAFEADGALMVAKANGTGLRTVTTGIVAEDVAWGPDGQHLVFSMAVGGNFDIYTIRIDGQELTRLTEDPGHDRQPTWAARGDRIAFVSNRSGSPHVWLMRADGSHQQILVPERPGGRDAQVQPDFAPNGRRLVVSMGGRIVTMRLDGSHRRTLGRPGRPLVGPVYSPDGRHVAAVTVAHKRADIAVLDAAGHGVRTIATRVPAKSPSGIFGLSWQPRGVSHTH